MKKALATILILGMLAVAVGCSREEQSQTITIQFWHLNPVGSPGFSEMRGIINAFNARQSEYFVRGTGFSFWDYWDKLSVAISSRTAPDVGYRTIDDVVARARNGVLHNISELMREDSSENNVDVREFRESQLEFARWQGDLWAMPFSATTRVLYYNLDMFTEAGLTEADVPKTWGELHRVAKQFDRIEGNSITRLGFDPTYGNTNYHGWLWQNGLDFFDEDLDPTLNTQGHLDVLNWIIGFNSDFSRGQLTAFGEASEMLGINVFASQRVAMIVDTDGLYQTLKQAGSQIRYGVAPIPVPDEDGIRASWGSGFSLEMFDNGTRDLSRRAGAWELFKYLLERDTQIALADANGWIMGHRSAMEAYAAGDPILNAILEEIDYAVDKVFVPYAPSWHGADWYPYYSEALDGTLSPADALSAARAHYLQKRANWEATR
jgi:multiple sugar transport system substrate-binding protein